MRRYDTPVFLNHNSSSDPIAESKSLSALLDHPNAKLLHRAARSPNLAVLRKSVVTRLLPTVLSCYCSASPLSATSALWLALRLHAGLNHNSSSDPIAATKSLLALLDQPYAPAI